MKSVVLTNFRKPLMGTLLASILFTTGCSVHKVAGEIAGVDVEASRGDKGDSHHAHNSSKGGFCPPGQRKKGNC